MTLTLTIENRLFGLGRKQTVTAHCQRHNIPIPDPHIGCPKCNQEKGQALDIFRQALESDDD